MTSQYIGHLENGHKRPTGVLVDALANTLGFEESFFYGEPVEEFRDEECHFRRRTTTPVGVRTRVLAHGSLFGALVSYLDASVEMPPENVPTVRFGTPEEIERAAERCRLVWGLGVDLPIKNLTRAVERAGVVVTRFEDPACSKVDAFSRAGRRNVVVLNADKKSPARSRFDLAHECGHLVGHHGITTGDTETERQADRFAGALLLPRAGFVREFPRSSRIEWSALFSLKERWGVSVSAIVRRAYELRLLPATQYQAAYKHMAYRGWLKNEPGEVPIEEPELVLLCVRELEKAFGVSSSDVARHLGWSAETFEVVAGVRVPTRDPGAGPPGKLISLGQERLRRAASGSI